MLKVGDSAPGIISTDQDGNPFHLSDLKGKSAVVLYFYPKDGTPVCTIEACIFRDRHEELTGLDAVVVGISDDPVASHKVFANEHRLPFLLLSDVDGKARTAFGLRSLLGSKARATFVIDKAGIIRAVVEDRLNAKRHVREALEALRHQGLAKS